MSSVVQEWLSECSWKQQSILFSGLRGPDDSALPHVKAVNRWMRTVSQFNADPSKQYMRADAMPDPYKLCEELEGLSVHYVHHLADALAVIAYNHPDNVIASQAASYHFRIAEELFHFVPELPSVFVLRHRDKPDGVDVQAIEWVTQARNQESDYFVDMIRLRAERSSNSVG